MGIDVFTGGIFDTNCFFLTESAVLIDAPQDTPAWLAERGYRVKTLLITHGHIDHVWDAAQIQREHGCRVGYHPETAPMVTEPGYFKRFGFNWEIEPVHADFLTPESSSLLVESIDFQVLHVPGHSPDSVAFFHKEAKVLFGGDVLMAGGVGRWDLPGGDFDILRNAIRGKLFPLGDDITVLPGHGPATKIGIERRTNPYVGDSPAPEFAR